MAIKVKVRPSLTKEQLYTALELKEQLITNLEDEIAEMDAEIVTLRRENGNLRALVRTKTAEECEREEKLATIEMLRSEGNLQMLLGNRAGYERCVRQVIAIALGQEEE